MARMVGLLLRATAPNGAEPGAAAGRSVARAVEISTAAAQDAPYPWGPSIAWAEGAAQRAFAGPQQEQGLAIRSQSVGAGKGFAYAHISGLTCGPISISKLAVTCIDGRWAIQIDGHGAKQVLFPGCDLAVEHLSVAVGLVTAQPDGVSAVTGLVITDREGDRLEVGRLLVATALGVCRPSGRVLRDEG